MPYVYHTELDTTTTKNTKKLIATLKKKKRGLRKEFISVYILLYAPVVIFPVHPILPFLHRMGLYIGKKQKETLT